jgi:ribosomal protein L29
VECVVLVVIGPAKEERDVSEISSLTVNSNPSPQSQAYTVVKLKNLRKKVRRLEKRLQEGQKKLAKLRQKLQAAQTAKAMKAARKPAARATTARPAPKPSTPIETKSPTQTTESKKRSASKKAKRKLNLSPERHAQLAAAMKARWAAKRTAEASTTPASADDQHSAPDSTPQTPELAPALAAVPMPPEAARLTEPSDEEIRLRAYFISEHRRRFALPGDADSDWREAKQQLLSKSGERRPARRAR